LAELFAVLSGIRALTAALGQGDLAHEIRFKGYLVGTLKALQASLRHLTWQTQRIASGDLSQRVDFMGEFASAFNTMVERLAEQRRQLELLATTDSLTGLYNPRQFYALASAEWERARRYQHPLTIIMLDLDHFKRVNDTYGHTAGDVVLRAVATFCMEGVRATDVVGRYGGEEMVILLPESDALEGQRVAERLRQRVAETPIHTDAGPVAVTISLGVSQSQPGASEAALAANEIVRLISHADAALYRAKHEGRNCVRVWEREE
jgi:diguanylate cyclase (GGDEF)-like protein